MILVVIPQIKEWKSDSEELERQRRDSLKKAQEGEVPLEDDEVDDLDEDLDPDDLFEMCIRDSRMGELGIVHRHEKSGQLHGLMRVRCFTQDDAHIFMLPEQITQEIKGVVRIIDEVYKLFGFKYYVELSTRPENSIGSDEDWEAATNALRAALDELKLEYTVNEGDGAFYGPKIDFHLEDSIKRDVYKRQVYELIDLMGKFVEQKPGGQENTYAFALANDLWYNLEGFFWCFGAYPDSWILDEDGNVKLGAIDESMREPLRILQKMYQDGWIDPEFATRDYEKSKLFVKPY